jgi:hypothetical protein
MERFQGVNAIRAIACISLIAATSAVGSREEFKCPDGAKDWRKPNFGETVDRKEN